MNVKRIENPARDAALAGIIQTCQQQCNRTYGYRRVWLWLRNRQDIYRNPKTILRIMKKYDLLSETRRRRKWQQMEQQLHKYENLLNREFHADKPNCKWVTDISYIHTGQGVLYLSVIRDLFDNSIIAYKTGTEQTVNLMLDTIRLAMKQDKTDIAAEAQLHIPCMSRRGNCYDNAMAENFFSILKTECIYRHKPMTFQEAREQIDKYIHFYNCERIQLKTGVAPLSLRHSS